MIVYTVWYQGALYQESDFQKLMEKVKDNADLAFLLPRLMRNMTIKSEPIRIPCGAAVDLRLGRHLFQWFLQDELLVAVREVA